MVEALHPLQISELFLLAVHDVDQPANEGSDNEVVEERDGLGLVVFLEEVEEFI